MSAVVNLVLQADEVCRRLRVRGQVQGVGFRPFVYRIATELGLAGWVRNDGEGVEIEIQGTPLVLDRFTKALQGQAPPLARISAVESSTQSPHAPASGFRILASGGGELRAEAAPDTAVCDDCLRELFDTRDRRYRYPFINCTQCGPRYSIIGGLPYDRVRTSMAAFRLCPACQREYESPYDRRFHAEPNACLRCGPRLWLCAADGSAIECEDVIAAALSRLMRGEILAIKGLGGFHLACDARNAQAVARLRQRKNREAKPFAVMLANAASAVEFCALSDASRALLESPERPVVLLPKRDGDDRLAGIAPALAWLGVMLPYTPLQYLLFNEAAGRPGGTGWLAAPQTFALVMTSANPGGEPLVIGNDEALQRLRGIADGFVMHDRDIVTRCDDSVVRDGSDGVQFIRRARGYTPQAIALARGGPAVLACGAYLKNTVCLTRGDQAFVSQHIGDLDNAATCAALDETGERLQALLRVQPQVVAHDLHTDFYSSHYAAEFARERGLPLLAVQHHHAHIAAVMAEHRLEGEVLGVALDGVGLGSDGGIWGGELLRVSARDFMRLGHLRELRLPGGDKAAREPWRMAAAALHALGRGGEIAARFESFAAAKALPALLASGAHAPPTSSCGRWFDAAAGLARVKDRTAFEGQAAMLYEGLAARVDAPVAIKYGYAIGSDGVLDLLPLLNQLADEDDATHAAALFHATLAAALADWVEWAAQAQGLRRVALGGGCFLNHILSRELRALLQVRGLEVFEARRVPPNDGGVSLGQAWVALNCIVTKDI